MGLETGNRIEDLNPAWPLGTDGLNQSDDHHRLQKACVQGSFPALGPNPVTVTADQINESVTTPPVSKVTVVAADGTWTKTSGMNSAKITLIGGGGGGASITSGLAGGGGGGAAGQLIAWLDISGITDAAILIGAAGAIGGDGGDTSWDDSGGGGANVLTATGGKGAPTNQNKAGKGGATTGGTANDIAAIGNGGANGGLIHGGGGNGGAGPYGGAGVGGAGENTNDPGEDGQAYGAGGGGATSGGTGDGGAGFAGVVIVEEYANTLI